MRQRIKASAQGLYFASCDFGSIITFDLRTLVWFILCSRGKLSGPIVFCSVSDIYNVNCASSALLRAIFTAGLCTNIVEYDLMSMVSTTRIPSTSLDSLNQLKTIAVFISRSSLVNKARFDQSVHAASSRQWFVYHSMVETKKRVFVSECSEVHFQSIEMLKIAL